MFLDFLKMVMWVVGAGAVICAAWLLLLGETGMAMSIGLGAFGAIWSGRLIDRHNW